MDEGSGGAGDARRPWGALVVAVLALTTAVFMLVRPAGAPPSSTDGEQMIAVSPGGTVELSELSAELQELYVAAAADPEAFSAVRCYCGCEAMLEHRHLLDCFVRPDGAWERHALGCGICQVEARDVIAGRAAGEPLEDIVADIDATYGGITSSQETDA